MSTTLDASDPVADATVFLPPIDPTLPPPQAACASGTGTAYLVAENGNFFTWDPATTTTTKVGTLKCPTSTPDRTPFTMTVTQTEAYVLYNDWLIYRVDLATLACSVTPFDVSQLSFPGDVGIATSAGATESLLVLGIHGEVKDLATTDDLATMKLREVAPVTPLPPIGYPLDTKVDGYGRLFAADSAGTLVMVDSASGHVLGLDQTGLVSPSAWALLTYDDQIFLFTGDTGDAFKWDLTTKSATKLGAAGDRIVGAGSAPCLH